MEEVYRTFVFLIKKNCYVSASTHLTQQFSCINAYINNDQADIRNPLRYLLKTIYQTVTAVLT